MSTRLKKADNITAANRIRSIQEWLMLGYATKDIISQGTTSWDVTERQVYRYLKEAKRWFLEETKEQLENRRAYHIATRMRLFKNLKNKETAGGAFAAMNILKDIAEIEGLYIKKIEHTGKDGTPLLPNDPLKVPEHKLIIEVLNADTNSIDSTVEGPDES